MEIITESGVFNMNKKSHFAKWLVGWKYGGGWTGESSVDSAWEYGKGIKPDGVSWTTYGFLMAREQSRGASLARREIYGK